MFHHIIIITLAESKTKIKEEQKDNATATFHAKSDACERLKCLPDYVYTSIHIYLAIIFYSKTFFFLPDAHWMHLFMHPLKVKTEAHETGT